MDSIDKMNMNNGYTTGTSELISSSCWIPIKNKLKVKRMNSNVIMPTIIEGNVGIDLRVIIDNCSSVIIAPGEFQKLHTGIQMEIPQGYYVSVKPRSSTGCKKTLRLMNTEGVIDSNYRGEILVFVHNFGKEPITVANNERLCQMIICKDENPNFIIEEVEELSSTDRGECGFGSTGRF